MDLGHGAYSFRVLGLPLIWMVSRLARPNILTVARLWLRLPDDMGVGEFSEMRARHLSVVAEDVIAPTRQ
jgi:hypothetical protein